MKRCAPLMPILALAFIIALPAAPGPGPSYGSGAYGSGAAFAQGGLLQCMEQCIRHEGGNTATNKETCKSRCANVPSVTGGGTSPNRDSGSCMSAYKDCQADCGKDKKCKRVCKKALMRCQ